MDCGLLNLATILVSLKAPNVLVSDNVKRFDVSRDLVPYFRRESNSSEESRSFHHVWSICERYSLSCRYNFNWQLLGKWVWPVKMSPLSYLTPSPHYGVENMESATIWGFPFSNDEILLWSFFDHNLLAAKLFAHISGRHLWKKFPLA